MLIFRDAVEAAGEIAASLVAERPGAAIKRAVSAASR
jgi:hypothetical protein